MSNAYKETLEYLFKQLPVYQRSGAAAYKPGIGNIIELCSILEEPQKKFPSIHLAGTNGKGSCSHLLSAILQSDEKKVGLYTSPHLIDFRERIKINGQPISEESVVSFVSKFKDAFASLNVSFFEWTVALAFYSFAKEKVDIAVIETGMGGRLDSTNIITPLISVITNIGLDHTQFLGDTLEKIAFEKAGIIKKDTPVVIGETLPKTKPVFVEKANQTDSKIYFAEEELIDVESIETDLKGPYQKKNIKTVLCVLNHLPIEIDEKAIYNGLLNCKKLTQFRGRFDIINLEPYTILDCAHNPTGIKELLSSIVNKNKMHIVFGAVSDKDVSTISDLFPSTTSFYLAAPEIPRAMPIEVLKNFFPKDRTLVFSRVIDAYIKAKNNALTNENILIFGSTFVVADFYKYYEP